MYPSGAGVCLNAHYNTKERIEALFALGDLSGLGGRLSNDDPEPDAQEAGKRGEAGNPQPITPSDSLIRAATYLANLDVNGNLTNEYPKPLIITETPEATAALREVQQECDRRYNFYEAQNEGAAKALWARAHEKVDHFGDFQNSSLLLKMTKFSNPSRWATSLSRKILREIRKNSHNLKIGFVYRKNALKRIRTCDLYLRLEMNHTGWTKATRHYSSTSPR